MPGSASLEAPLREESQKEVPKVLTGMFWNQSTLSTASTVRGEEQPGRALRMLHLKLQAYEE